MNGTKSVGLRMPVQSAVNRTATYAALTADGGVEAQWGFSDIFDVVKKVGDVVGQVAPYAAPLLAAL
jgi:hypothetical protein